MSKVCIDAGHYGKYNRSPVNSAYYESVRMWKLHELLARKLESRGVTVIKTRTDMDKDMDLTARGKKAKGCDLFVSLHSNASSTESVDYPVAIVMRANVNTTIDDKSNAIGLKLAQTVQKTMNTRQTGRTMTRASSNDRDGNGLKDDEYYGVLQGAKVVGVPGLILEHSFHTNKRATDWLMSDANLSALAEAEAECIADWLGVKKTTTVKPAIDPAHSKSTSYNRSYTVNASGLNMRSGAGTSKTIVKVLKKGEKVRCYGYYTNNGSTTWLYVQAADGTVGYCAKAYLI